MMLVSEYLFPLQVSTKCRFVCVPLMFGPYYDVRCCRCEYRSKSFFFSAVQPNMTNHILLSPNSIELMVGNIIICVYFDKYEL